MKNRFASVGILAMFAVSVAAIQVENTNSNRPLITSADSETDERGIRGGYGACCLPDGTCYNYTGSTPICEYEEGGTFYWGQYCEDIICEPQIPAACCLPEGGCEELSEGECNLLNGSVFKEGLSCAEASCSPTCDPPGIFSNHAYPLEFSCGSQGPSIEDMADYYTSRNRRAIDIDGDGIEEICSSQIYTEHGGWSRSNGPTSNPTNGLTTVVRQGSALGSIELTSVLNLHPDSMIYHDITIEDDYYIVCWRFLDVTGDGLPDALITVRNDTNYYMTNGNSWYYVENISTPPAAACASDSTGDGVVNVDDLIAMIADWGACE